MGTKGGLHLLLKFCGISSTSEDLPAQLLECVRAVVVLRPVMRVVVAMAVAAVEERTVMPMTVKSTPGRSWMIAGRRGWRRLTSLFAISWPTRMWWW
jgi:hypothetical protein